LRACERNAEKLSEEVGGLHATALAIERKNAEIHGLAEDLAQVRGERDELRQVVLKCNGFRTRHSM
jgi:hypothetical protein